MNEWGEIHALLTNDVSSSHLSLGVRVSCMGAANHGHKYHGYDNGNYWHEHYGYDNGNYRHYYWHEHYGNYRYHW